MKILDIIKKVGGGLISEVLPGGGLALAAINAVLPSGVDLPSNATGDDLQAAISALPEGEQAELLNKQVDLQIVESNNWAAIQASHAATDATGASTRPKIAMLMAYVVAATVGAMAVAIIGAVLARDAELLKALGEAWELIAFMLGTPMVLLRAYFGLRTQEKKARYAASIGSDAGAGGLASTLIRAIRG